MNLVSILVLVDVGLRLSSIVDIQKKKYQCFNPCFSGCWSATKIMTPSIPKFWVSILVLVDVGLRLYTKKVLSGIYLVSILVLVDVGLRLLIF